MIYSDSQNYVYSGQFFLSQPLLQWKKRGENLEKFIRVEQASEHKKIKFAQCKIRTSKNTAKFTKIRTSNICIQLQKSKRNTRIT